MKAVSPGALAGAVFSHWSEGHAGIRGYAPVLLRPAAALASFGRGQMRLTERRHRPHVVRTGNAPIVTRRGRTRWQASSRPISETEEDAQIPRAERGTAAANKTSWPGATNALGSQELPRGSFRSVFLTCFATRFSFKVLPGFFAWPDGGDFDPMLSL
jgi:hypothetical protein